MDFFKSESVGSVVRTTIPELVSHTGVTPPLIPKRLSLEQLCLKDKEFFFQNNPIKLTPYSEILKKVQKLTSVTFPDPAQFDRVMREIHEREKGKKHHGDFRRGRGSFSN